ncbi:hypothetical protein [Pseudomonas sp. H2_H03]
MLVFSGACSVAVLAIYGAAVLRAQLAFQRTQAAGSAVMSGV